jgi:hypothetical protein
VVVTQPNNKLSRVLKSMLKELPAQMRAINAAGLASSLAMSDVVAAVAGASAADAAREQLQRRLQLVQALQVQLGGSPDSCVRNLLMRSAGLVSNCDANMHAHIRFTCLVWHGHAEHPEHAWHLKLLPGTLTRQATAVRRSLYVCLFPVAAVFAK